MNHSRWCYSIAVEAVPLVQLSNSSFEWFIVKYYNVICSRYKGLGYLANFLRSVIFQVFLPRNNTALAA